MKYMSGLASMVLGILTISAPILGVPLMVLGYYIMSFGDAEEAGSNGEVES